MKLARITGTLWATKKDQQLEGLKRQLIQPISVQMEDCGATLIAVDTVGAGTGEIVYFVTASEAVIPLANKPALVDASIVGIVDKIELRL